MERGQFAGFLFGAEVNPDFHFARTPAALGISETGNNSKQEEEQEIFHSERTF
jgi:hypothetical protein